MKGIPHHRWFGLASLAIVAGYFVVGLWPFDFHPPNRVSWLADHSGLHFKPYGIVYDPRSLPLSAGSSGGTKASADFTVELWITAAHEPPNNIFDILTIHNPQLPYDFTLCQWKQDFLLRATIQPRQRAGKSPEVGMDDVLLPDKPRFLSIRGNGTGIDFYLNGKPAKDFSHFVLDSEALDGRLILGNDASGKQSWTGSLRGLALYHRALGAAEIARHYMLWTQGHAEELTNASGVRGLYLFNEGHGQQAEDSSGNHHHLIIPAVFEPVHRGVLIAPWKDVSYHHLDYLDIAVNVLGFMPFGFCFFLYGSLLRPARFLNIVLVIFTGAAISLTIEIIQAWLPNRVSSTMDLLTNTIGTLFGVALAVAVAVAFRTPKF